MRAVDSISIASSDLGRPALAGLSSLTTWTNEVEETISKAKSCDDVKAQAMASKRSTTTRAATSDSSTINAAERLTPHTTEGGYNQIPGAATRDCDAVARGVRALQSNPHGRSRTKKCMDTARS